MSVLSSLPLTTSLRRAFQEMETRFLIVQEGTSLDHRDAWERINSRLASRRVLSGVSGFILYSAFDTFCDDQELSLGLLLTVHGSGRRRNRAVPIVLDCLRRYGLSFQCDSGGPGEVFVTVHRGLTERVTEAAFSDL